MTPAPDLLTRAHAVSAEIIDDIRTLVSHETGSYDLPKLAVGLDFLQDLALRRLGAPEHQRYLPGSGHGAAATLTYAGTGPGHVALLGHYDTVWPTGTLDRWPAAQPGDTGRQRLGGPGIFDMKTGLAQGIWALKLARESGAQTPAVTFVFTGDEEIGSPLSRPLIEEVAKSVDLTLVLEPSAGGAVKTGRKGTGIFTVTATGVESHAGLAPGDGASAILALAEFVVAAAAVADPAAGTTINTGLISGGTGSNVVAGQATASVDIRVRDQAEQQRVDAALAAITVSDPRARITIAHHWNRPPMTLNSASVPLLRLAQSVARDHGRELGHAAVGGASDANFIAALGLPVLCGLGAVGGNAHAAGEFIYPDTVAPQTALVAGMLGRLGSIL
ncbi:MULTISPECIES: M20 family metallopeptidase [unclassified Crossiella]|uniref:M20 family metallopeptidase n=1 Tax=unclassified Crossiella TaxID=2620835 RepID=UPI001FFF336E|nr:MULTISPECIES: M20 family metallopeptidase [unclassified Crossiella]MCK2244349.1 M20 family metallopeptidase [Crossiella sp. S99.2]MCK2257823.1 M20 family metallopeptidase [Crossiella sp. S99.1]